MKAIENIFSDLVEAEFEDKTYSDHIFEFVMIFISILIGLYLLAHQMWSTGFFTTAFSTVEMLLLYGSLIFWIVTLIFEIILGRRNLSTLFNLIGGPIFFIFGIIWLLVVFPFDFAHFADVAPDFLRFLVEWIDNNIARVLMVLLIIIALIVEILAAILHVLYRRAQAKKVMAGTLQN